MKLKYLLSVLTVFFLIKQIIAQPVLIHTEGFEGTTQSWGNANVTCSNYPWMLNTFRASEGVRSAVFQSSLANFDCSADLVSPLFNITDAGPDDSVYLEFSFYRGAEFSDYFDRIEVYFLNSAGVSVGPMPTPVVHRSYLKSPVSNVGWAGYIYFVKLSNAGTGSNVSFRYRFRGISGYGDDMHLDDFKVYHIKKSPPTQNQLILTNPNGGNTISAGNPYNITWFSQANVNRVKIDFSINGGLNWVNIANNVDAKSFVYSWVVPNTSSQTCKVRITDVDNPSITDESDAYFTITPPTFVSTITEDLVVKSFPNPVRDKLFLTDLKSNHTLDIAFYDMQGKLIYQTVLHPDQQAAYLDIKGKLESGMYVLAVSDGTRSKRMKITVSSN